MKNSKKSKLPNPPPPLVRLLGVHELLADVLRRFSWALRFCRGELHAEKSTAWRPLDGDLESSDL